MSFDHAHPRPLRPDALAGIPEALHIGTDLRPFADDFGAPGVRLQLLLADVEAATFVARIKFAPGVQLPPHHHTGVVFAYTLAGEWSYLEYPDSPPSTAGSYLYEPPGSAHTLKVSDHNRGETDVVFIVTGAASAPTSCCRGGVAGIAPRSPFRTTRWPFPVGPGMVRPGKGRDECRPRSARPFRARR